ncbi:MAG: YHS domain-containing (seleno)protein [Pseudoruegeria sp.]
MKKLLLSTTMALFTSLGATASFAGDQYIDHTGFAVSGYDVVAYFDLPQTEVGTPQVEGVSGRADITAEHNGATFAFSTEENRDRFVADPEHFAPQFDGHCAYGVAQGGKVPGNPNLWRIVDGELFLNITKNVVGFWEEDIPGNITLADGNWVGLEPSKSSEMAIPQFSSSAPIQ